MRDLYTVLGVPRDADQARIKKAFKKLARRYHPDINKDPGAEEKFKEINAAHGVLGDESRRALYDEFGEISLSPGFDAEKARAYRSMGGNPFAGGGRGGGVNLDDLLSSLFGGGMGGSRAGGPAGGFGFRGGRAAARKGADLRSRIVVDLLTALRGGEVPISLRRPESCGACRGQGGAGRQACAACRGSGRTRLPGVNAVVACSACGGQGATFQKECGDCAGTGRITRDVRLNVKLPRGIEDSKSIRLRGQAGEGQGGGPRGDVILEIGVRPHPRLRREGMDLHLAVPLTLYEAMSGGKITVPTPWGDVSVKVPPGRDRLRLRGRGVRTVAGEGDLYLDLRPVAPPADDPRALELAAELEQHYPSPPRTDLRLD